MKVLLDTCACLFFAEHSPRLSPDSYALIAAPDTEVFVSAASVAEIACLQQGGRLALTEHWRTWFRRQLAVNGWAYRDLTLEILEEAWSLPEPIHRDPADRAILATARLERMTVITTDRRLLDYPHAVTKA